MADWITLDPKKLNPNEHEDIDGVEIIVGLSPYDIPEGVRGDYSDEVNEFVIEFKYLDNEEALIAESHDEYITLMVGEHSQRLYAIHVDVDRLRTGSISLQMLIPETVQGALERLKTRGRTRNRLQHYDLANAVIRKNKDKILASV